MVCSPQSWGKPCLLVAVAHCFLMTEETFLNKNGLIKEAEEFSFIFLATDTPIKVVYSVQSIALYLIVQFSASSLQ